jgi:hypothetical protein
VSASRSYETSGVAPGPRPPKGHRGRSCRGASRSREGSARLLGRPEEARPYTSVLRPVMISEGSAAQSVEGGAIVAALADQRSDQDQLLVIAVEESRRGDT